LESIAIIPARKGSKRVPGKNKSLFKGKSLVAHTIEQALDTGIFDSIFVSSDDPDVIQHAEKYEVTVLKRELDLSGDNATLLNVIRDLIKKQLIPPETCVGLLLVTAPLRAVEDLKNAYKLFVDSDRKQAVVSVCSNLNPIDLSWSLNEEHLEPVFPEGYHQNISKHFRKKSYYFNDACIFDNAENFLKDGRNLFGQSPLPYIMPHERSIFIDFQFQLELIQLLGGKSGGAL
jgi:CMP-N-acetylneuraminic acid synthetase